MAAYSSAEWDKFVADHGGIKGTDPVKSDATIPDPDPMFASNPKFATKNPYQAVKYTFGDGTYITVRPEPGAANEDGSPPETGFNVVNGGTALKASTKAPAAPTTRKIGDHTQQWDPTTGQWIDPPGVDNTSTVTPKDTVPGTGTPGTPDYSQSSQGGSDPSGPSMVGGTPDQPVDVVNAQTARANSDRQAQAQAWAQAQDRIQNDLAAGRLTLDQAIHAATEAHQAISEQLQRDSQALTQRGQNLDYLGKQSWVTAGQYGALQDSEGQAAKTGGVPFTPSPTPAPLGYDPRQIGQMLAAQVLGGQSQQPQQGFSLGNPQQSAQSNVMLPQGS